MDCRKENAVKKNNQEVVRSISRAAFIVICTLGLYIVGKAAFGSEMEWQMLILAALAYLTGPLWLEVKFRNKSTFNDIPILHSVLFASALTLGPLYSALPGISGGIAKIFSSSENKRPLYEVLYLVLKPAVMAVAASSAYIAAGGSTIYPHRADSILPMLIAGGAYIASGAIMTYIAAEAIEKKPGDDSGFAWIVCAWTSLFAGGYSLAVLYTSAPFYVLLVPAIAISLFWVNRSKLIDSSSINTNIASAEIPSRIQVASNKEEGYVDDITGLANQRYLKMFIGKEISRAERSQKPLSLAVFDIDGFKKISEDMNQEEVDKILVNVGQSLKSGLRDYDLVGRYSAGRFLVVLPEASLESALEISERLHHCLANIRINGREITVSAGIASYPDHASDAEELINAAHHALNTGRFSSTSRISTYQNLRKAS